MTNSTNSNHKQFYIATANLLNFANPNRLYYPNAPAYSEAEYNHKLHGITDLLSKAHADIIAVQEVWDSEALTALAVSLGLNLSRWLFRWQVMIMIAHIPKVGVRRILRRSVLLVGLLI